MSTAKKIAKNTTALVVGDVISKIFSLVLIIYVAKYAGADGLGKYSFAFAFVGLFGIISGLGLDNLIVRELSRDKNKTCTFVFNLSVMRLFLSFFMFTLIYVAINTLNYPADTRMMVYIIGLSIILNILAGTFRSVFRASEQMGIDTIITIFERIIVCIGGPLILYSGYGLTSLVYIILLGSFSSLILSITLAIPRIQLKEYKIDWSFWKYALKQAVPLTSIALFATIYSQIDSVMLSVMKGDEAVGWYNAAYRMMTSLSFIPVAFIGATFPVMSRLYTSSRESLVFAYKTSFKYLFFIALPLAVGTTIMADHFIYFFYGDGFANSVLSLQILIWTEALIFLNLLFGSMLYSINRQNTGVFIAGASAILNVVLNLILIPSYSYAGAAAATVATELLVLILCLYIVYRYEGVIPNWRGLGKAAISSALMGIFLLLFNLSWFVAIPLAVFTYFSSLYLIRGFDESDMNILRQVFRKEKTTL